MERRIETLADLSDFENGKLSLTFENELRRLLEDIHERPGVAKPRQIVVAVNMQPATDADGTLEDVKFWVELVAKAPAARTRTVSMGTLGTRGLFWNDLSTANHKQHTIDEELVRKEQDDDGA